MSQSSYSRLWDLSTQRMVLRIPWGSRQIHRRSNRGPYRRGGVLSASSLQRRDLGHRTMTIPRRIKYEVHPPHAAFPRRLARRVGRGHCASEGDIASTELEMPQENIGLNAPRMCRLRMRPGGRAWRRCSALPAANNQDDGSDVQSSRRICLQHQQAELATGFSDSPRAMATVY
jgi:hypothetical protein